LVLAAFGSRQQQRAQPGEAVGIGQPETDQLAEGVFQLAAQQVRLVLQLVEEQRALIFSKPDVVTVTIHTFEDLTLTKMNPLSTTQ
jgi:hypothetical protein